MSFFNIGSNLHWKISQVSVQFDCENNAKLNVLCVFLRVSHFVGKKNGVFSWIMAIFFLPPIITLTTTHLEPFFSKSDEESKKKLFFFNVDIVSYFCLLNFHSFSKLFTKQNLVQLLWILYTHYHFTNKICVKSSMRIIYECT